MKAKKPSEKAPQETIKPKNSEQISNTSIQIPKKDKVRLYDA